MTVDLATIVRATGAYVLHLTPAGELSMDSLTATDLYAEMGESCIDSRAVSTNGLFVALQGEHVDGHGFVQNAFEQGARAALVRNDMPREEVHRALRGAHHAGQLRAYVLLVPDPLHALQALARAWRRSHSAEVIGITGSIGKTTTKDIVASVLSAKFPVLKSEANHNTEIGLPLALMRLRAEHRAAVLEMGMYVPGDIATLSAIAEPRIGIVTNVHPIHLERAGSIERIARAKSELVAALPTDGVAVLNADDPWTRAMAISSGSARVLLVGLSDGSDYRIGDVRSHGMDGTSFTVTSQDTTHSFRTQVPGAHTIYSFASAIAVAREMGLDWTTIGASVESTALESRQRMLRGPRGVLIIDDSYNAAPPSMNAALDLLDCAPGQHVAVLGDMLELGPDEMAQHSAVGARAAQVADWLVVRGPRAQWIADGAEAHGLSRERVVRTDTNDEAAAHVLRIVHANGPVTHAGSQRKGPAAAGGDDDDAVQWSVLVKASRGMELEQVVSRVRGGAE